MISGKELIRWELDHLGFSLCEEMKERTLTTVIIPRYQHDKPHDDLYVIATFWWKNPYFSTIVYLC